MITLPVYASIDFQFRHISWGGEATTRCRFKKGIVCIHVTRRLSRNICKQKAIYATSWLWIGRYR